MMMASNLDDSAMRSWKDLVKVNGSFYCNLSPELAPSPSPPPALPREDWSQSNETIYVNKASSPVHLLGGPNRTILRIGDDDQTRQPVDLTEANNQTDGPCHTIKLVIGEPLSLDTSEYVSWDGSSQTGPQSGASAADDDDDIRDDEEEEEPDSSEGEEEDSCSDVLPAMSSTPIGPHGDELTHSCCRYFDERQQKLSSIVSTTWNRPSTPETADDTLTAGAQTTKSTIPGLNAKMEHLRREIVSLVNQDDVLFRQLLALNTSIRQLRSQSLQRRARTLSSNRSRSQLSPSISITSLTSLTSLSDGEDAEVEEDSDPDPKNVKGTGPSTSERPSTSPAPKPVIGPQTLTRKRVSYPPKSRNRSNSQLSRCSFNSSSSSSSSSSTSSGSPTWSLSSTEAKSMVKGVKTPRSPHSSFYSRSPVKNQQLSTNKQRSVSEHADLLMVFHKRQGSYDSGCQGSEPSDAEVFV